MSFAPPRRRTRRAVSLSLAVGAAVACATTPAAFAKDSTVVADGLANPRGLTIGPNGDLFVAEAGKGGSGACIGGPEGDVPSCVGATGAITRVDPASGAKKALVSDLPSLAAQTGDTPGGDAIGPQDISFSGKTGFFTVGLGAPPDARDTLGSDGKALGKLWRVDADGDVHEVVDLAAYEAANDPDQTDPAAEGADSNPFSVDATGRSLLVTDAGGNDLLRVTKGGDVRTVAVFPFGKALAPPSLGLPPGTEVPYQPVPTGVIRGSHGDAIVGQLTGFPFPVDKANIFRVHGRDVSVEFDGFTNVVDVGKGKDGALYVVQITSTGLAGPPSPGKLIRIDRDGKQTELLAGQLQEPTGVTVSAQGDVYVTNNGGSPTDGQILRVAAADTGGD
ncbi:MAG: hypothetical protein QOH43_69 [Solirubrobacteraceae bacterium]|nr:hypothetical protein [Solirubrobacteraceae bacterium]